MGMPGADMPEIAGGGGTMKVREASLDDTHDIVAVHLTNPDPPFDRPLESLTIAERCAHGGPWMAMETCAIHLNNLLAWGYAPLVVEHKGKVIAETEFYVGRDIPPLGTTLDISVLYVHSDHQRRGAGTLLVEEMISRARHKACDHITVSGLGGPGSPGFYGRFGFTKLLQMQTLDCSVPKQPRFDGGELYVPRDFEKPPNGTLWVGRFLSPCQKWREIVDGLNKRDLMLPSTLGGYCMSQGSLGYIVSEWGNRDAADLYLWGETLSGEMVSELLVRTGNAGYRRACLLCHPDMADVVAEICACRPTPSWSIWGKRL